MPYHVYILRSAACNRHYCGQTDNLAQRIAQHKNSDQRLTKTTKRFPGPWVLIWHRALATRREAMALERKVKSRGIARFLQDEVQGHGAGGC